MAKWSPCKDTRPSRKRSHYNITLANHFFMTWDLSFHKICAAKMQRMFSVTDIYTHIQIDKRQCKTHVDNISWKNTSAVTEKCKFKSGCVKTCIHLELNSSNIQQ